MSSLALSILIMGTGISAFGFIMLHQLDKWKKSTPTNDVTLMSPRLKETVHCRLFSYRGVSQCCMETISEMPM